MNPDIEYVSTRCGWTRNENDIWLIISRCGEADHNRPKCSKSKKVGHRNVQLWVSETTKQQDMVLKSKGKCWSKTSWNMLKRKQVQAEINMLSWKVWVWEQAENQCHTIKQANWWSVKWDKMKRSRSSRKLNPKSSKLWTRWCEVKKVMNTLTGTQRSCKRYDEKWRTRWREYRKRTNWR